MNFPTNELQRVLILGPCGAGKSTLAMRLGSILGLPVVHLDALNWQPGWVMAPNNVFRARMCDAVRGSRWIIDGNYSSTLDLRLPHADTIVFLDFPRWRCMLRVIKRVITHAGRTRPDMGQDCPEKFDWEFMEFVWNWFTTSRPKLIERLGSLPHDKRLIVLRTPRDVEQLTRDLERAASAQDGQTNNLLQNAY